MATTLLTNPRKIPQTPSADPMSIVADAVKKVSHIATLPEVTARIVATVEDPKSTASQLHKIVSHDPALVTRILKVVNSAFYGLPGQIGSVERAIVLLGLNAVKNIAVAASLGQLFRGVKLCEGFTARDLWTHCIAVAVTARELAKQGSLPIADEAFLAGLIHDIGLLVAMHVYPEKLAQVCDRTQAEQGDFCQIEREICGVDHQQLGTGLTEQWKFTRPCQMVAAYHHHPQNLADNNRVLVLLVHIADTMACKQNRGFNLTALQQNLDPALIEEAGISKAIVDKTQEKIGDLISNAMSILG